MSTAPASSKVRPMTSRDPGFYPLLGPYLSNRDVVRKVGGTIWDDPGKLWLVAGRREHVRGFVALARRDYTWVESLYCTDGHDDLAPVLVAEAVDRAWEDELHAKVRLSQASAYQAAGFVITDTTASFATLHWMRTS